MAAGSTAVVRVLVSLLKGLLGQGQAPGGLSQASNVANYQAQLAAMQGQQNAYNPLTGGLSQAYQRPTTWEGNVPVWDEGGYEPWVGKVIHSVQFMQRCLFL